MSFALPVYDGVSVCASPPQTCKVLNATTMLCKAPALPVSLSRQQEVVERPDEFGFILDGVQAVRALSNNNFLYYPNPVFETVSPSGIQELKPGSPIILKVAPPAAEVFCPHPKALISKANLSRE